MQIQTQKKLNYLDETKGLIRDAIKAKGQTVADFDTFRSYADKINAIEAKADPVVAPLEVTENGTYTAPDGVDGYNPVTVNVPTPEIVLQDKTITENGTYTADSGYDGLGSVTVEVAGSDSGASLKFYKGNHAITAALDKRIEINFGFTPDFILLYPAYTISSPSKEVFATAISEKWASTFGVSQYYDGFFYGSSSLVKRNSSGNMGSTTYGAYLYAVDSTGFNLGSNYNFASITYTVVAIGL